jgi:hypothetical protein
VAGQLVTRLLPPKLEFDTGLAHVEFLVERVALGQGIVHDFQFSRVIITIIIIIINLLVFHTHNSFTYHRRYIILANAAPFNNTLLSMSLFSERTQLLDL